MNQSGHGVGVSVGHGTDRRFGGGTVLAHSTDETGDVYMIAGTLGTDQPLSPDNRFHVCPMITIGYLSDSDAAPSDGGFGLSLAGDASMLVINGPRLRVAPTIGRISARTSVEPPVSSRRTASGTTTPLPAASVPHLESPLCDTESRHSVRLNQSDRLSGDGGVQPTAPVNEVGGSHHANRPQCRSHGHRRSPRDSSHSDGRRGSSACGRTVSLVPPPRRALLRRLPLQTRRPRWLTTRSGAFPAATAPSRLRRSGTASVPLIGIQATIRRCLRSSRMDGDPMCAPAASATTRMEKAVRRTPASPGLPYDYFVQTMMDFKNDARKSADPRKANTNHDCIRERR